MKTPITIPDSTRLSYRLMDCSNSSDIERLFDLDQDPEVMRYLNDGKPSTRAEINNILVPRVSAFTDPLSGCGLWALTDRNNGEYLGWILVRQYGFDTNYHEHDNLELGWRLKRHCWGKGLATEAARTIMELLQQDPAIRVISAIADADNLASTRVMQKLGMRYTGLRLHKGPKEDHEVEYFEIASPCYNPNDPNKLS